MRLLVLLRSCALAMAVFAVAPVVAHAAPSITGTIGWAGNWTPVLTNDSLATIGTAQKVHVVDNQAGVILNSQTGDLTAIVNGSIAFFDDIDFTTPSTPITPLWGPVAGFTFDLTSVTVTTQTATDLGLAGQGVMKAAGFADTVFDWNFTSQGTGSSLTFSTSSDVNVPVPATIILLGLGLIGIGGLARAKGR